MRKNIKLLALFNFFTDFHLFSAILIIYFVQITGSYVQAMSLFSVTMVSSAFFELPTGIFSDYIGRKKTMILGAICSVISIIMLAIGNSYWILFLGSLFAGLQRAWYSGNNTALLYESLATQKEKDEYAHYLGKTSSMFQIAAAVGIIFGGFIATFSFPLVMWLSVIPQLICLIIAFLIVEPPKKISQSTNIYIHLASASKRLLTNPKLRLLSLTNIITYSIGESTYQFRAAFVNTLWPLWAVGFSKVFSSLGSALSFWYSGRIIKKVGDYKILLISSIYGKIINIGSVAFPTLLSPLLLSTTSLFHGVTSVANSKLLQKEFTDDQRATLGSIQSFMGNIVFGAFAIILGYLSDIFGPGQALLIAYLLSLSSLFLTWKLYSHRI